MDPSALIDPALDVWVWSSAALLLVVLGARAWAVETARGRPGRTATSVRLLTIGSVAALGVLFALLVVQGGDLLAQAVVTGEDPFAVPEDDGPADAPTGDAVPVPAAPAAPADPAPSAGD